ncbi:MAG TPA: sugar phosphate isomerase/epimerase family protein [Pirellulales bacterium]|jgi:sugar phosphate isomerase/epimerase
MPRHLDRREFLASSGVIAAGVSLGMEARSAAAADAKPLFEISLAEWSLHRAMFKKEIVNIDFPLIAKRDYGISAVEYVNQFFKDKATDKAYLTDLKQRAADNGVNNVLIMIDNEGALGAPAEADRKAAAEKHYKWVDAAKFLGCHAIRVNVHSQGTPEEQARLAADGLRRVAEYGRDHEIEVIVENHGGNSSNGLWLAGVIKAVDMPKWCGTLPDFGNFNISKGEVYDRYKGVAELMPYAKAVSAKSHDFDADGNETKTDYKRMMKIVLDAGYHGYVGIEYEGSTLPEPKGIELTKKLLERVRKELA